MGLNKSGDQPKRILSKCKAQPKCCQNPCNELSISIDVPNEIICGGNINGSVRKKCGKRVKGVEVYFESDPSIVTFDPNPAITDWKGVYETTAIVDEGENTSAFITATTSHNGKKAAACGETNVFSQTLYEVVEVCNTTGTITNCTDISIGDIVCIPCKNDGCPNEQVVAECGNCSIFLQLLEGKVQKCTATAKVLPEGCTCRHVKFEIFGEVAPWVIVSPPVLCPGQEFTYEIYMKVTVEALPGALGIVQVQNLDGQLAGANEDVCLTDFIDNPPGTVVGAITPDGQEFNIEFLDYVVEGDGNVQPSTSINLCPALIFEGVVKENALIGDVVTLNIECSGTSEVTENASAFINSFNISGPFAGDFEFNISFQTTIVSPDDPCCT
ncbi:hypothetical protein [Bacillus sp. SM2101]|uniref:hypothetical protein n=1 Tax=Bacillus sp. SM2101 TaxID=2805366 RepID=UPI001BDF65A0|nr:hypothetical protein [Bacillus sp. SM2101]